MLGYQKTSIVREKSEFAVRGNIIDIYPFTEYATKKLKITKIKEKNLFLVSLKISYATTKITAETTGITPIKKAVNPGIFLEFKYK